MAAQPILSPAQLAAVHQALQQAAAGKQICQQGAACGFDLTGPEAVLHDLQQRLQAIQHHFGPKGISSS